MSTIIYVDKDINDYDIFVSCLKIPLEKEFRYDSSIIRIGFVWHNTKNIIPFGSTQFEYNNYKTNFFTLELINYLSKFTDPIIVDLISCSLNSSFFYNILK
jgi:hypothetical protein